MLAKKSAVSAFSSQIIYKRTRRCHITEVIIEVFKSVNRPQNTEICPLTDKEASVCCHAAEEENKGFAESEKNGNENSD